MGVDTHIIMIPSPGGPVPTPLPHPFSGLLDGSLSSDVKIMGMPAATLNSTATNTPPHIPQGGPFQGVDVGYAVLYRSVGSPNVVGKHWHRRGDVDGWARNRTFSTWAAEAA